MTRSGFLAPLAAAVLLVACGGPSIPPAQNYATVYGRVYDAATDAGVAGAIVTVDVINAVTSGPDGSFTATNVPIGPTDVTVVPPSGYTLAAAVATFSVVAGDRFQLNIPLTHTP